MRSMHLSIPLVLARSMAEYRLPNPSGKYNVTLTNGPLIDYARNDPYAATPTPRALMLSVFQPATCESTILVPYMPIKTAQYQGPYLQEAFGITANLTDLFLEARLPVCPNQDPIECSRPADHDNRILLFSPGWAIPRLYYSFLASALASDGFTVITIDHPEDANIITYPDGHTVYNNASTWPMPNGDPTQDVYVRAEDVSFLIDQLQTNATAVGTLLPQRGPRTFSTRNIAMLGHSLGGATSIIAASRDPRIRAAVNWDGTLFGSLPQSGLSQPVLMFEHPEADPPDWLADWPHFEGPKLWLEVANTTHQTYSDVPTLLQAAGVDASSLEGILGTIAPTEMVRLLTAYTSAWMEGAFADTEGQPPSVIPAPGEFPEVSTIMKGNF